jgi:uncharacterized small protein (DUF1192 family)
MKELMEEMKHLGAEYCSDELNVRLAVVTQKIARLSGKRVQDWLRVNAEHNDRRHQHCNR